MKGLTVIAGKPQNKEIIIRWNRSKIATVRFAKH